MSASVVIGQSVFNSNSANQGGTASANTLNNPADLFISGSKIVVANRGNNRVLIYSTSVF